MTKVHSEHVDIVVSGTIKTIANAQTIKEAIRKAHEQHSDTIINLIIKDSFIITSSVIGYVIKSIEMDKIALHVNVGSEELYEMLEDMNLIDVMNVRKDYRCAKA
ncbi:hypothetical protein JU57_02250 [Sulfurospirillum sp. SCADC]|nr:hypothetical protein JU57_02250 [Sulfurospirillum sp. SCADC]